MEEKTFLCDNCGQRHPIHLKTVFRNQQLCPIKQPFSAAVCSRTTRFIMKVTMTTIPCATTVTTPTAAVVPSAIITTNPLRSSTEQGLGSLVWSWR